MRVIASESMRGLWAYFGSLVHDSVRCDPVAAARRDLVRVCSEIREELEPETLPLETALALQGTAFLQHPVGTLQQNPTIRRQKNALTAAIEQRHAQFLLQSLDAPAQGGLA